MKILKTCGAFLLGTIISCSLGFFAFLIAAAFAPLIGVLVAIAIFIAFLYALADAMAASNKKEAAEKAKAEEAASRSNGRSLTSPVNDSSFN